MPFDITTSLTRPERDFDEVVKVASAVCGTPIAYHNPYQESHCADLNPV